MAERRMFAKTIIDSDAFLDMPQSTQLLYFHLSMRADDDGFINNPKSIMRNCKCSEDDLKMLAAKKFIIPFQSGVVVIKHWKIHNYIAKDRYKETKYKEEKSSLALDDNNAYTECIQDVHGLETQVRLGKDRLGKDRLGKNKEAAFAPDEPKPQKDKIEINTGSEQLDYALSEYEKMRKKIRKPMTKRAMELAIGKLQKMTTDVEEQVAIVNQSVMNSWQGLFPLKEEKKKETNVFDEWRNA